MDQTDWLVIPNYVCRLCGIELVVNGTAKRPVSEFYAIHPKRLGLPNGLGLCPHTDDVVRLDSKGQLIEKLVEKGVMLQKDA